MKYKWWWICLVAVPAITMVDGVCYGFVGVTFLMNSNDAVWVRISLSVFCAWLACFLTIGNLHINESAKE